MLGVSRDSCERFARLPVHVHFGIFVYYAMCVVLTVMQSIEVAHIRTDPATHRIYVFVFAAVIISAFLAPIFMFFPDLPVSMMVYEVVFVAASIFACMHVNGQLWQVAIAFFVVATGVTMPLLFKIKRGFARYLVTLFLWIAGLIYTAPECIEGRTGADGEHICVRHQIDHIYTFVFLLATGLVGSVVFGMRGEQDGWCRL